MLKLNNRIWLTVNTEIFTDSGWVKIDALVKGNYKVLSYDNSSKKLVYERIKSYSSYDYKGPITVLDSFQVYKEFAKALVVEKCGIFKSFEDIESPEYHKKRYSGKVYNLEVMSNHLFVRHPRGRNDKTVLVEDAPVADLFQGEKPKTKTLKANDYYICLASW